MAVPWQKWLQTIQISKLLACIFYALAFEKIAFIHLVELNVNSQLANMFGLCTI